VINDILDMSKIEAGRMALMMEPINIGDIAAESLRVVEQAAQARNIELKITGNASIDLEGDRRALKQVLINLLSNAVKFTPVGGEVTMRVYRYRGQVRLAIADTGVGIPRHEIAKLGRPFEQVENQLTKVHKGTGLGLAISRSIVELHGGRLEIKSRLGEGTTVTCILPASQDMRGLDSEAA
jgi:two-component system cell cycle sensor histidine kinase PleC